MLLSPWSGGNMMALYSEVTEFETHQWRNFFLTSDCFWHGMTWMGGLFDMGKVRKISLHVLLERAHSCHRRTSAKPSFGAISTPRAHFGLARTRISMFLPDLHAVCCETAILSRQSRLGIREPGLGKMCVYPYRGRARLARLRFRDMPHGKGGQPCKWRLIKA